MYRNVLLCYDASAEGRRALRQGADVVLCMHSEAYLLAICRSIMASSVPEGITPELVRSERVLASITEAIIGACYLEFGFETTAPAVVEAFRDEIAEALERPLDFKSALQELLARRGDVVAYVVTAEEGPPHDRTFSVVAQVEESVVGRGSGRSKQDAEQAAARAAIEALEDAA